MSFWEIQKQNETFHCLIIDKLAEEFLHFKEHSRRGMSKLIIKLEQAQVFQ